MGKYTKQKSGLYRTTIQIGYTPEGKPKKKYLSAPTIKELEQKVFEAKTDMANGMIVSDFTQFGDYAQQWLKVYKATKGIQTQAMYKRIFTYLGSIWNIPLKKINRMMIQGIINENIEHPRTCEQILLTVKQIFKSAQNDGMAAKNPCIDIELPRHVQKEQRALTDEEKQKLRSAILPTKERLFLLLLYGTGCRPSEIYALTKSDFDLKQGTVSISKSAHFDNDNFHSISLPKTNASIRSVYISEPICKALSHLLDKIPTENILGDENGQIMKRSQYVALFKRILQKAGLEDSGITQYTFRHNFCTECWHAGIPIKECMNQMGHQNYKMIMEVYTHLDEKKANTRSKLSFMVM